MALVIPKHAIKIHTSFAAAIAASALWCTGASAYVSTRSITFSPAGVVPAGNIVVKADVVMYSSGFGQYKAKARVVAPNGPADSAEFWISNTSGNVLVTAQKPFVVKADEGYDVAGGGIYFDNGNWRLSGEDLGWFQGPDYVPPRDPDDDGEDDGG